MLLILSSEQDFAVDYLIVRLIDRGLPYFRINTEELILSSATLRLGRVRKERQVIAQDGRVLDLDEVKSVWYRRAIQPIPPPEIPNSQRVFVAGEYRHFWNGLLLGSDVLWVNPPHFVQLAEHKLLQLQIAQTIGFLIPDTLVSRSANALRVFAGRVGAAICKPVFHGLFIDAQGHHSIYTRRVTLEELQDDAELEACPVLLQEEIARVADIRVTLIGEHCFAARIRSHDRSLIDWRLPDSQVFYEVVEMPPTIQAQCKSMMALWQLQYAAFDFIETPNGDWIFLEVNPTGEWAWLEDCLGFAMRDAFIQLFYGKTL